MEITDKKYTDEDEQCQHIWADKVESGFLNEIVTFRKLTSTEIDDIKSGKVYPKGIIVCINCGTRLFHLEKVSGFINIDDRGWDPIRRNR